MPSLSFLPKSRFPRPRVIFCDVDGTLLKRGEPDVELIAWLREKHAAGFEVIIWSMRGRAHAQAAVDRAGLGEIAAAVLSKPGYLVDDRGWGWRTFTKVFRCADDWRQG